MNSHLDQKKGLFSLVLHAHLPFVRHPEEEYFRQENWLFDALTETYLPLLRMFHELEEMKVPFRLTISLSPTLESMLSDTLIKEQYLKRLDQLLELADKEIERTVTDPELNRIAGYYKNLLVSNKRDYTERYRGDILSAFYYFQRKGNIDFITTTATHCFLPLYQHQPHVVLAQIRTALELHDKLFSCVPEGFWLPECGYYPGLEDILKEFGIKYFISSAHGILYSESKPRYGVYSPVLCPNGVAAFGMERSHFRALYSSVEGYPTNPVYRNFFRDIGYELASEYVAPYMGTDIGRVNTGFKYYAKGTGNAEEPVYNPDLAKAQARIDADSFARNILEQSQTLYPYMEGRPPLIVCAFDAELFGHWWFEGVEFLKTLFIEINNRGNELAMVTPSDYLDIFPQNQQSRPAFSSWGDDGYSQVLLDHSNDWIYRHTNKVIEIMTDMADRYPDEKGLLERTLNQAARETLLSLASDWPFILKTGSAVSYAKRRIKSHIYNVNYIFDSLSRKKVRADWLTKLEKRNNIFPDIDYRIFRTNRNGK